MSSKRNFRLAALLLCAALVWPAAGCGGSGETETDRAQAAPAEAAIPSRSRAWSKTSPAVCSNSTFKVFGKMALLDPFRFTPAIRVRIPSQRRSRRREYRLLR